MKMVYSIIRIACMDIMKEIGQACVELITKMIWLDHIHIKFLQGFLLRVYNSGHYNQILTL